MISAILTKFAETYPEVLTNPESVLGPNAPKVLEFWRHIDGLSKQEKKEINDRYCALDDYVRWSAIDAAYVAAIEVVGREFSNEAWTATLNVTGCELVFSWATEELIGNVENKVFYDLIMSYKTF
jgi:hypothetical protein